MCYNAIRVGNYVFIDASSPMGISPSPKNCNAMLRALMRIAIFFWPHLFLKSDGATSLLGGFMDDLICGAPTIIIAYEQIQAVLFIAHLLGFEFKPSKFVWPTRSATAIGLLPNLRDQTVAIKPEKFLRFLQRIKTMLGRHFWTLNDLQELGGNWIWAAQITPRFFQYSPSLLKFRNTSMLGH